VNVDAEIHRGSRTNWVHRDEVDVSDEVDVYAEFRGVANTLAKACGGQIEFVDNFSPVNLERVRDW
jgi:hypothetical protein